MQKRYRIAVVGAGITGLALAGLLKQHAHDVVVFEKAPRPRPLGAGLVLQPSGLAALANLNRLDKQAIDRGAKIGRFCGQTSAGKTVYDLHYRELNECFFALGIHRASLFSLLYEYGQSLGVSFIGDFDCQSVLQDPHGCRVEAPDGQSVSGFDLVVDASGTNSKLRDRFADIRSKRPFPYGVLWGICTDDKQLDYATIHQSFHYAQRGLGLVPIGSGADMRKTRQVALHWSLRRVDLDRWSSTPLERWKEEVVGLFQEVEGLVCQFRRHDELTFASYREVVLNRYFSGRLVFIGDACHSMSPRLGQGANLGLLDALVLTQRLSVCESIDIALSQYERDRRNNILFYHRASKWIARSFQSDSIAAARLRDWMFVLMTNTPYARLEMLKTLSGYKSGLLRSLSPDGIHPSYRLRK